MAPAGAPASNRYGQQMTGASPDDATDADRRRHQRVAVNLLGRFMLSNQHEYPCQVTNMSPGGVALVTPVAGEIGERVVVYIDHIGRVEGQIARIYDGGFAITINASGRKREKLADQLTWLANRDGMDALEDRRHDRMIPQRPESHITLPDGRIYECMVIDMSISGAAVSINVRPALGTQVTLGKMRARVVRHLEQGIALEFIDTQDARALADHFGLKGAGDRRSGPLSA